MACRQSAMVLSSIREMGQPDHQRRASPGFWHGPQVESPAAAATHHHHFIRAAALITAWSNFAGADPINLRDLRLQVEPRADTSLVGHLGTFYLGADLYIYFYQSSENNPLSFKTLNKGQTVLKPTAGIGGFREPAIVQGGDSEAGKKWYIVGTDLNIAKTIWDAAQRTGSRGILVWENTDLVHFNNERLVIIEDATAGMVWAPEAFAITCSTLSRSY
ncbi:hypothetical protein F5Y19DRAFT_479028 [Xylariaceae sp. FL1651]|nr:hypothetical protein F5Y19DRAFT_479028 [Xylariaceae sp. FL1651]